MWHGLQAVSVISCVETGMVENPRNYKTVKHYHIAGHAHELTFSCYHHEEYLGDNSSCELFLSELKRFRDEYSIQIWAYVLMPNHSKKREVFRFWQPGGGFDRNLWEPKAIHAAIGYIEANPVRKKLAINPEEYQWSSAYARRMNAGLVPDYFNIPVILPDPLLQSTWGIK